MNNKKLYSNVNNEILDDCIADVYRLELTEMPTELNRVEFITKDLYNILQDDFLILQNIDKKSLENKNLKILFNNLSHLVLGNTDWNYKNKEETAKLLYGIKYWVHKDGGSFVVDFMIKNDFHVDLVFLFIELFDKYV